MVAVEFPAQRVFDAVSPQADQFIVIANDAIVAVTLPYGSSGGSTQLVDRFVEEASNPAMKQPSDFFAGPRGSSR
jgi:hypothetical protein